METTKITKIEGLRLKVQQKVLAAFVYCAVDVFAESRYES
jgi:hypothetical protein